MGMGDRKMKLRDIVFRTSNLWANYAISVWDRNSTKESTAMFFHSISELENFICSSDNDFEWYDVVNVLPISGGTGIHYVIAKA